MNSHLEKHILEITAAKKITGIEAVQAMWSGFGEIVRVELQGGTVPTVMAKLMTLPTQAKHPRGWHSDLSSQRKLRSYAIERHWYQHYAERCQTTCKVPGHYWSEISAEKMALVMEDLTTAYPICPQHISLAQVKVVLDWLAQFHALHLSDPGDGLWPIGTYWHLDTRPDELAAMNNSRLKEAAPHIDAALNAAHFQTLVHGDAKLANFCFDETGTQVAGVDFQYVGRGCGVKDVAYFFSSCLAEEDFDRHSPPLLSYYFEQLHKALQTQARQLDFPALEREWRQLYPYAWADFHRFINGWSPDHWKLNGFMHAQTEQVLLELGIQ